MSGLVALQVIGSGLGHQCDVHLLSAGNFRLAADRMMKELWRPTGTRANFSRDLASLGRTVALLKNSGAANSWGWPAAFTSRRITGVPARN